ncbi:MAG TPA: hypothetical protein VNC18_09995, partial [Gemmatimonadaceae bacterium]|nr:hypothetical protein [Gemmatimonadaceae bacterium]
FLSSTRSRSYGFSDTPGRAMMRQPNVPITLTQPLVATGAYGTTRTVTEVGFAGDDPSTFSLALAQAPA